MNFVKITIALTALIVLAGNARGQDSQKQLPPPETMEFRQGIDNPNVVRLVQELEAAKSTGDALRAREILREIDSYHRFDPAVTEEWKAQLPNVPVPHEQWDGRGQSFYDGTVPQLPEGRSTRDWGDDILIAGGNLWGTPAVASSPAGVLYVAAVNLTTHRNYLIFRSTNGGRNWTTFFASATLSDSINYVDIAYVSGGGTDSLILVRDGWNSTDNYRMHCLVFSVASGALLQQTTIATNIGAYRNPRIVTDNINYPPSSTYFYLVYQYENVESSFRRSIDFGATWSAILYNMSGVVRPAIDYGRNAGGASQLFFVGEQGPAPQRQIAMAYTTSFGTGTWNRDTLTTSTDDDYDVDVAVSNNDSVRYVVYTNNYFNTGDLDTWCAYTTNAGTSWTRAVVDFTTDTTSHPAIYESYAAGRFYRIVYVKETSVINDLLYRSSSAAVPSWSAATVVSDNDVAGENSLGITSTVRPAVNESAGNGRIFYVTWFGNSLYTDGFEFTSVDNMHLKPASFALEQNYPNPFNPATNIRFSLPKEVNVSLKVYDVLGREIATLMNGVKQPGTYEVIWDARGVPSGVYFYRLAAGEFRDLRKMILLK